MGRLMRLAHRHAERPGHVPCVPGDGRPAQGVMRPHAPQAVVRPNQALMRLPPQGPPPPDQEGNRLIYHGDKIHPVSAMPDAQPPCSWASAS